MVRSVKTGNFLQRCSNLHKIFINHDVFMMFHMSVLQRKIYNLALADWQNRLWFTVYLGSFINSILPIVIEGNE